MSSINKPVRLVGLAKSKAIRISREILKQLNLDDRQQFDLVIKNNAIVLLPYRNQPRDIHELFSGWPDDGQREHELDWGQSVVN
ncbi:PbsX family transcriptional regulator [Lactiplantibacillus fabifermentans T30PCM01]|uniref:PbsX family transcriptional regulator n=1 Tax=Lactiplantibacillus fabifermentans T30PCM01 TaxID=1400520 RepID=W6T7H0_9LACO|nr:PbsX family transcriptional regulator [Lactiplantibacillus fabifermentans T30PCM01]